MLCYFVFMDVTVSDTNVHIEQNCIQNKDTADPSIYNWTKIYHQTYYCQSCVTSIE